MQTLGRAKGVSDGSVRLSPDPAQMNTACFGIKSMCAVVYNAHAQKRAFFLHGRHAYSHALNLCTAQHKGALTERQSLTVMRL